MTNLWKDADWEIVAQVVLVLMLCIILGAFVLDITWTDSYAVKGQVVGAEYTPSSSGVGSAVDSKGNPVVVTTYQYEKWTLVLSFDDRIETFQVSSQMFHSVKVGDWLEVPCRKGKVLGIVSCTLSQPYKSHRGG